MSIRLCSVIHFAAVISLFVCASEGQGSSNSTAAVQLDEIIQCLNASYGLSGECYNAAVITAHDVTKRKDHCATDTELNPSLESSGCNTTNTEEIFHCLCPNVTSGINRTTSPDHLNSTDADTPTTVNVVVTDTTFVHSLNVSNECKDAVLKITEAVMNSMSSPIQLCLKLKENHDSLVNSSCSLTDYSKVYNSVCLSEMSTQSVPKSVGTTQGKIVTLYPKIVVNVTLENKIWSYINLNLTSTCRSSINPRVPKKITDMRRQCKMFRQSGEALIANRICSGEEVTTLTNIFCYSVFHGTQIPDTEDGRKELALFLIAHGLTQGCHNVMQPQVDQFQDSIARGCTLLTAAKVLLVQSGMCSEMDIAKLDPVVCYEEPPKDNSTTLSPEDQKHRDRIETLVNQMSVNCNEEIHGRFKDILESKSGDTCHVVSASYDAMLRNSSCTDQELSSFSKSVCDGSEVVVISLVVLLLCLFVSVEENDFF